MTTTKSEMPTTAADPEIVAHYEDLRRQAVHPTDRMHRGTGFVLFVRRGMRSWMEAWLRCSPSVPAKLRIKTGLEQVSPIQGSRELVSILASMARNSTDWHRLLEICALTDTLILDEDGIYDDEGLPFRASIVRRIAGNYRLKTRFDRLREAGMLTVREMSSLLGVTPQTVKIWKNHGLLAA